MLSRRRRFGQPYLLSRRWRFGQPYLYSSVCQESLGIAPRMPRRLPNPARLIIPCLEMPATARVSAFARRAAHSECKIALSCGQTQVKLRARLASEMSRDEAYNT